MEKPLMSMFSKVVSFAFLTSTLVTGSLGKSMGKARSRTRKNRRTLARMANRSLRAARSAGALPAAALLDAAQEFDRKVAHVGRR
jgi:hypothetical protein